MFKKVCIKEEAVIAMESRDHLSNGRSSKSQKSRGNIFLYGNMRKVFLIVVAVLITGIFAACDKESSGDGNGDASLIKATSVQNSNGDVASVLAILDYKGWYKLATAKYNNGFKITFPSNVSKDYLISFEEQFGLQGGNFGIVHLYALNDEYNIYWDELVVGELLLDNVNSGQEYVNAYYTYADKDFTAKGSDNSCEVDCSFKKGWNILYLTTSNDGRKELFTTKKPSGVVLQWRLVESWG